MLKGKRQVVYVMLITAIFFYSCEKEVSSDMLVERNGLQYEVNSEKPFSGKSVEYFDGGEVKSNSKSYKEGQLHGQQQIYFNNGQMKADTKFKDGLASGAQSLWYENGQLWSEASWKDGKFNGTVMSWRENGQPDTEEHYKDDILHGVKKMWYKNGRLRFEGNFKDGILVSSPKRWLPDGTLAELTDIDGNVYEIIKIGSQVWMAENLKVTHYRDGTEITNVTGNTAWSNLSTGAYCYYGNNSSNGDTYGALYNRYAVNDSRNIAPEGWRVPTDAEWKELEMYLGMSQSEAGDAVYRGTNEGSKLAGNADLWDSGALENDSEFGSSGFTALPGGYRNDGYGSYLYMGSSGYFWSATEYYSSHAWGRVLSYSRSDVYRLYYDKSIGFSVRCVRD